MFLDFYSGGIGGIDQVSFYDRGVACGLSDVIEAHKWFNLAALAGDERGVFARQDVAADMSARDVAEAQRRARTFLQQQREAA